MIPETASPNPPQPWLENFADPPASHRPMPFFVWNGEVTERRITEVLEQYRARGCGGAFIHPRPGLITEYLSERWFALWRHALEECRRLGLECHIYDENSYPSGFAGGHVPASHPMTVARSLIGRIHRSGPVYPAGEVLAAYRLDPDMRMPRPLPADQGIEGALSEGPVFTVSLAYGEPRSFSASFPKVDLTLPATTEAFLETTHRAYARRFREEFGQTIRYCFTDEPNVAGSGGPLASPYLLSEFQYDHGYDLRQKLSSLFFDLPGAETVRYHYFSTLNRLWVNNFLRPIYRWCEDHQLQFTGHFWEHMWPDPGHQPSAMQAYRWMQAPGIDLLAFQFHPEDRASTIPMLLACKEVGSVARQLGRERVLCETTGGGGYHCTLIDFKPLTDFCQVYGVNLVNPHLTHQTLVGSRKFDWGHTFSDHSSWWEDYRHEADHEGRLTWALTRGTEVNRVLLLQPTTTAWLHKGFPVGGRDPSLETPGTSALSRMKRDQGTLINSLTERQVDFDLGDEFILEELGEVQTTPEGARLKVGLCSYQVWVIPHPTQNLRVSTVNLLRQFLEAGGTVFSEEALPGFVDGSPDDSASALAAQFCHQWQLCPSTSALVDSIVHRVPPRIVSADGRPLPAGLCWTRRELENGYTLHVLSNPWHGTIVADILLEGQSVWALNTLGGEVAPFPSEAHGSDRQKVRLDLPFPSTQVFLCGPHSVPASPQVEVGSTPVPTQEVKAHWTVERESPNQMTLEYGDLETPFGRHEGVPAALANVLAWQAHGFATDPWIQGIQFRRNILEQSFRADSGVSMEYPFFLDPLLPDSNRAGLELGVERPNLYKITVNGKPIANTGPQWWDEEARRLPIGAACLPGLNRVRLTLSPFHPLCELQPLYLLGDFAVEPQEHGFSATCPRPLGFGEWQHFGLHLYPWTLRYRATFDLQAPARALSCALPSWQGSTVRIEMPGTADAVLAFPPYTWRREVPLAPGQHTLTLRLRGVPRNAIGPYHHRGHPLSYAWTHAPQPQPAGKEHILYPVGLTSAPVLMAEY